jgi:hypothetical protein
MVPGAESNIKRKQLIHNASLNEIWGGANNEANAISALKNHGFDSLAKPTLDLGSKKPEAKSGGASVFASARSCIKSTGSESMIRATAE